MPAQPTTDPPAQTTANDRNPRKHQARLDDNGEPAGVPAPKKTKSVERIGPKKKVPAKTRPEKKTVSMAASVETISSVSVSQMILGTLAIGLTFKCQ